MGKIDKEKTLELLKEIKHAEDVNRVITMIEKIGALDVEDSYDSISLDYISKWLDNHKLSKTECSLLSKLLVDWKDDIILNEEENKTKAILVIDIDANELPKDARASIYVYGKYYEDQEDDFIASKENVPLKPMPRYINSKDEYNLKFGNSNINGWNSCIDEILGEK